MSFKQKWHMNAVSATCECESDSGIF